MCSGVQGALPGVPGESFLCWARLVTSGQAAATQPLRGPQIKSGRVECLEHLVQLLLAGGDRPSAVGFSNAALAKV